LAGEGRRKKEKGVVSLILVPSERDRSLIYQMCIILYFYNTNIVYIIFNIVFYIRSILYIMYIICVTYP